MKLKNGRSIKAALKPLNKVMKRRHIKNWGLFLERMTGFCDTRQESEQSTWRQAGCMTWESFVFLWSNDDLLWEFCLKILYLQKWFQNCKRTLNIAWEKLKSIRCICYICCCVRRLRHEKRLLSAAVATGNHSPRKGHVHCPRWTHESSEGRKFSRQRADDLHWTRTC